MTVCDPFEMGAQSLFPHRMPDANGRQFVRHSTHDLKTLRNDRRDRVILKQAVMIHLVEVID